jgi:hypothetical protein
LELVKIVSTRIATGKSWIGELDGDEDGNFVVVLGAAEILGDELGV